MTPEQLVGKIDDELETGDTEFGRETLEGIRETVIQRGFFTQKQAQAVDNVIDARARNSWRDS
jgi:hypothetical protein